MFDFYIPLFSTGVLSFWENGVPKTYIYLLATLLLTVGTYDTVVRSKYYTVEHHAEFKRLAVQMATWTDHYKDVIRIANVSDKYYWNYYWVKMMRRTEKVSLYSIEEDNEILILDSLLDKSNDKYLIMAWSNRNTPHRVFETIEKHYPYRLESSPHFNSAIFLYSKMPN